MWIKLGEEEIRLMFHHQPSGEKRFTSVDVIKGDGAVLTGVANCNPSDPFSKPIGRALALRRALLDEPRAFRCAVFAAYHAKGAK